MEKGLSKTARRSMMDAKNLQPKVIAWAWRKGVRVGQGRKPDFYLYEEDLIKTYEGNADLHTVRLNSAWSSSSGAAPVSKRR